MNQDHEDPLEKIPEFLAAISSIFENGYFEDVEVNVSCYEGRPLYVLIRMTGYIPSSAVYSSKGCGDLIDVKGMLTKVRALASDHAVTNLTFEVRTEDWPLYDDEEEHVLGSKGTRTYMRCFVDMCPQ